MMRGRRSIQSTVRWTLGTCLIVYVYVFSRLLPRSPIAIPNNAGELENALGAFRNESPSSLWRTRAKKKTGGASTVYGVNQGMYKNIRAHPVQVLGLPDANAIDDDSNQNHARRKLQDKLDNVYISTGHSYDGDLWELSDYVPQWMKGKVPYCGWLPQKHLILFVPSPNNFCFVLNETPWN
jgi:hypothetical protein